MSNWYYKGKEILEIPKDSVSFVYRIVIDDKAYIGKKNFYRKKTMPPLKGKKRKRVSTVESNWKTYCSSSSDIEELVRKGYEPERCIIRVCYSLKEATYFEIKHIMEEIHNDWNLNGNVSGKFYKKEIMEWQR